LQSTLGVTQAIVVTDILDVAAFNKFKALIGAVLRTDIGEGVRGVYIAYNPTQAHARLVAYYAGDANPFSEPAASRLLVRLEPLAALSGLPPCAFDFVAERSDAGPLFNRGCPVYQRADVRWVLAPELQARLNEGTLHRLAGNE
jgi:hypothetical protein